MKLSIKIETWPIRGHFTISRSSLTDVKVVTASLRHEGFLGRGECRPYARYGETPESVAAQLETIKHKLTPETTARAVQNWLPAGAARNALDCALWDLRCKREDGSIWNITGQIKPKPHPTAFTLSVDAPTFMENAALEAAEFDVLKLKVDPERISQQIQAVAHARPAAQFIVDANEALTAKDVYALADHPNSDQIALIEQPLHDDIIDRHTFEDYDGPLLCADESMHGIDDLPRLKKLGYKAVNIKLDKCGGISEALHLIDAAKAQGFMLMGGCMLSTSLAVAPMAAMMGLFDIIDLDGGALLETDREHGLIYKNGRVYPPTAKLWG